MAPVWQQRDIYLCVRACARACACVRVCVRAQACVRACVRAQIKKLEAEVTELADELDLLRKENERIVLQLGTRAHIQHARTDTE